MRRQLNDSSRITKTIPGILRSITTQTRQLTPPYPNRLRNIEVLSLLLSSPDR